MSLVRVHPVPTPRGGAGPAGSSFDVAWAQALDELELDVDRAEELLRAGQDRVVDVRTIVAAMASQWTPPAMRTPLPDTMRERAERLLERQLVVTGRLAAAMTSSRRHLDLVERLVPSDPRPMYVDQAL